VHHTNSIPLDKQELGMLELEWLLSSATDFNKNVLTSTSFPSKKNFSGPLGSGRLHIEGCIMLQLTLNISLQDN